MVPTFIRSASDFKSAVKLGITQESLVLEFKERIDWKAGDKSKLQKEVCRDIAQFANTVGGSLLIGVKTRFDSRLGAKIAGSVVPVAKAEDFQRWIEQAIITVLLTVRIILRSKSEQLTLEPYPIA